MKRSNPRREVLWKMNKYIGKNCPYCKTAFTLQDEIIVCSACDMPHHKECWVENQGCTTFGCLGTIKAADNAVSSVTTTQMSYDEASNVGFVFCTSCGTKNANTSSFCTACGTRLVTIPQRAPQPPVYTQSDPANTDPYAYTQRQPNAPYQQNTPYQQNGYQQNSYQQNGYQQNGYQQNGYQQNGYRNGGYNGYQSYQTNPGEAELQQLVGTKTEYYMPRFRELKVATKKTSWNWAAFLITPYWLMYRKMYAYAAAVLGVDFVISALSNVSNNWFTNSFLPMSLIGAYVASGLFANWIYMDFLEKKAGQARNMAEPMRSQYLASNGGVNVTAAVLAAVGRVVMGLLLLI